MGPFCMKKFSLISHVLPPDWSGQSIVLGRIFKDIDPASYVLISSRQSDCKNKNTENELSGKYYYLKSFFPMSSRSQYHGFRKFLLPLELLSRTIQIIKIVRQEACICIVACSGDLLDIPSAYFAGLITNRKVIPYYFDDFVFQWSNPIAQYCAKIIEKLVFKRTSQVIVPNEFMKETIDQRQHVKSTIVRNPTLPVSVGIKPIKSDLIRKKQIVFTGSIYHTNLTAFQTLVAAMDKLKDKNVEMKLYTAQSVDLLRNTRITGDNIKINNYAPSTEITQEQQQADILFIPFSFDSNVSEVIRTSSPGKLADYLSSGVPILAFVPSNSYVAWFLKKHQCGFVIENNDPVELANGIVELLTNDQLRKKIVLNAFGIASDEFTCRNSTMNFLGEISKTLEIS